MNEWQISFFFQEQQQKLLTHSHIDYIEPKKIALASNSFETNFILNSYLKFNAIIVFVIGNKN